MRKFSVSLPVSAMIVKQGNNFTTAKIFKKVCKTLFITVTILSLNLLQNDCCFKIIVATRKITENFHMTKVTFLHHFCRWALTFSCSNIEHIALFALLTWRYVIASTLKRHWHYHIWQTVQRCIGRWYRGFLCDRRVNLNIMPWLYTYEIVKVYVAQAWVVRKAQPWKKLDVAEN